MLLVLVLAPVLVESEYKAVSITYISFQIAMASQSFRTWLASWFTTEPIVTWSFVIGGVGLLRCIFQLPLSLLSSCDSFASSGAFGQEHVHKKALFSAFGIEVLDAGLLMPAVVPPVKQTLMPPERPSPPPATSVRVDPFLFPVAPMLHCMATHMTRCACCTSAGCVRH